VIYISSILGGPEVEGSEIDRAIKRVIGLRRSGQEGDFGSLDVVFHIPGSMVSPDYQGLRTGKFSRKERMLMVQVSVPPDIVRSDGAEGFVVRALEEAVRMAKPRFEKAGIPYPESQYLREVADITAALVH
jgi:hypothetical protein